MKTFPKMGGGVFSLGPTDWGAAEKAMSGAKIFQVDLTGLKSKTAVLNQLGQSLRFPDYYGENFDALHDCLTDPDSWQGKTGAHTVLRIDGLQTLQGADPEACDTLLEILQSATEAWRREGKSFWILLDVEHSGIPAFHSEA